MKPKIKTPSIVCFKALLFTLLFCPPGYASEFIVNSNDINLRCDATVSSPVISKLNKGAIVEVEAHAYGWCKIHLPKNAPSFVKKNLVKLLENQPALTSAMPVVSSALNQISARVIKDRVNVRLEPSESAPILGHAERDEVVKIIKTQGDWYKIEPLSNSFGWVNKKFITEAKAAAPSEKEVKAAKDEVAQNLAAKSAVALPQSLYVVEGIVKPNGIFFKRAATHKLIDKDNKIYWLKAQKPLLNSYSYRRVRISGRLLSSPKNTPPLIEATKIEPL